MTKRILSTLSLLMLALVVFAQGKAKYVFFFIGDGMGVNQVNAAETYRGALEGRIGISPMVFPSFPYSGLANTQSATNGVTDSAAGGTALATGRKTKNGTIGMNAERTEPMKSIAYWAQKAGAAVGVTTSVSVDHATPASFYAHQPDRNMYYEIGQELGKSQFDFFAGSDFLKPNDPKGGPDLYEQTTKAGYTIVKSYKEYQKKCKKADRMVLLQSDAANKADRASIPYALDRKADDLKLTDITRAAINFLTKKQNEKNGFFLMVEGGKIDWACHANDIATTITETIDMDEAVRVAYEFYEQHPDETLIIVTADHETGGLSLGRGPYELHLDVVRNQSMTIGQLGNELHKLHDKLGDGYNWEAVQNYLRQNFGFWDKMPLTDHQNEILKRAFDHIMAGKGKDEKSMYQSDDELASMVKRIYNENAMTIWGSGGHSNGYVPVFAIGAGAELFTGRMDNTDITKRVAQAAGYTFE